MLNYIKCHVSLLTIVYKKLSVYRGEFTQRMEVNFMKNCKFTKRIFALLLSVIMVCSLSATAFAAEVTTSESEVVTSENAEQVSDIAVASAIQQKTIPAWGSTKFYLTKTSPLPQSLYVSTSSNASQGGVIVTAVNSKHLDVELSDNWVMGINENVAWTLATVAGTIIVQVSNHSPEPLDVSVWL